ncbi:hypothetical protein GCM10023184_36400 [Flaviaesturariibacter amylovorans]|uniref:Uncharacterized protein n=1 Tax=Flaviaesturariibacter amylovorans TaxID=1084520 RepID=A0ABP8HHA4_9BACT
MGLVPSAPIGKCDGKGTPSRYPALSRVYMCLATKKDPGGSFRSMKRVGDYLRDAE